MRRDLLVLLVLSVTQITGWGAVGVLPVVAPLVARDLSASLPSVFAGTSVMFVAMALTAPFAGRAFRRFGMRTSMSAGAAGIGLGLALVAAATHVPMFWAAWAVTGSAGALFLTTAAYAYLAAYAENRARSLIATLMLVTGLSGSVFWPATAGLVHLVGWQGALAIYGAVMVLLVAPLLLLGLPATETVEAPPPATDEGRRGPVFALLVAAIALNSFVTFGVEAVGIQLLHAMGLDLAAAIAVAALLGVFKVGGRVVDLIGGRRWDGLSTAVVSGAMIPLGLAAMVLGGAGPVSIGGYLVLFGVGSGAFAVARATMPLVFFKKADYAAAMSGIALPMNLINALAPPVIAASMAGAGAEATFAMLGALSLAAFLVLIRLNGLRSAAPSTA